MSGSRFVPSGVTERTTVGEPVAPSPLKERVAKAAFKSACVPLSPIISLLSSSQPVGSASAFPV